MTHPTAARILYVHGLESGPLGRKAASLRDAFSHVHAPDMQTGTTQWGKRNSFVRVAARRALTTLPWRLRTRAIEGTLEEGVRIQSAAIQEWAPDLVVGSSFGGAILQLLLARGHWSGPTVLLCPALRVASRRAGPVLQPWHRIDPDREDQRIAALPAAQREQIRVVHGDADEVVPLADSQQLCATAGVELEVVPGGDHGLGVLVTTGRLDAIVREVLGR